MILLDLKTLQQIAQIYQIHLPLLATQSTDQMVVVLPSIHQRTALLNVSFYHQLKSNCL